MRKRKRSTDGVKLVGLVTRLGCGLAFAISTLQESRGRIAVCALLADDCDGLDERYGSRSPGRVG
jgi:hypothetical protein